jgi:hypothetical protein
LNVITILFRNKSNGNKDWYVTQVTILLIAKTKENSAADQLISEALAKEYNKDIAVPPLTSTEFDFSVDGPEQEYSWNIVSARGYWSR